MGAAAEGRRGDCPVFPGRLARGGGDARSPDRAALAIQPGAGGLGALDQQGAGDGLARFHGDNLLVGDFGALGGQGAEHQDRKTVAGFGDQAEAFDPAAVLREIRSRNLFLDGLLSVWQVGRD